MFDIAEFRAYHWARYGNVLPIEGQTLDALERIQLEDLYTENLACEGPNHPRQRFGHRLEAPAEYLVKFRCGHDLMMCAPWVAETKRHQLVDCGVPGCGLSQPTVWLIVVPL